MTQQAVLLHRASRMNNRPQELVTAIPPHEAMRMISDVRRNTLWSSFRCQLPGQPKPTRMNVHRMWRKEMDQLLGMLHRPARSPDPAPGTTKARPLESDRALAYMGRGEPDIRFSSTVEMAGIEPASNGAKTGLLRVQFAAIFSAPAITRTSRRRAQSLFDFLLDPVTGSRSLVP